MHCVNYPVTALTALSIGFIGGWAAGLLVGENETNAHWQRVAVEHGHAEYDSQTGEWQWIEEGGQNDG